MEEFNANWGLGAMKAGAAYDLGFSGEGQLIAIIDSGFDIQHVDLRGTVHPSSQDVVPGQDEILEPFTTHGTAVAGAAAGNKNQRGSQGVAFDAELLLLAVYSDALIASGCTEPGCFHSDEDNATAFDIAVAEGATVINYSLAGKTPNDTLLAAMKNAVDNGAIIVIAAGNDGQPVPADDIAALAIHPDFAGSIIIVGGSNGDYDGLFNLGPRSDGSPRASNTAGITAPFYVIAPGEGVLVPLSSIDSGNFSTFVPGSGTSFAAPHISGFAALLFQAFPNLTAQEIVEIILTTATDIGAPGVDATFGHGLANIAAAFAPLGVMAISTSFDADITDDDEDVEGSGFAFGWAFGDAFSNIEALKNVMILDKYKRSFLVDMNPRFNPLFDKVADLENFLHSSFNSLNTTLTLGPGQRVFFGIRSHNPRQDHYFYTRFYGSPVPLFGLQDDPGERIHELGFMKFDSKVGAKTAFTFATGLAPDDLFGSTNEGISQSFNFVTRQNGNTSYFSGMKGITSTGLSWQAFDKTRLVFITSYGKYKVSNPALAALTPVQEGEAFASLIGITQKVNKWVELNGLLGGLFEKNAILGSISSGALKAGQRTTTWFAGIGAKFDLGKGFELSAKYLTGFTSVVGNPTSLITGFSTLRTSSFSAVLAKSNLFVKGDNLGIFIGQPLHIDSGTVSLRLPTGRDYDANRILFTETGARVSPTGREIDYEIYYSIPTSLGFSLGMNLFYQQDAGHINALHHYGVGLRIKANLY